MPLDAHPHRRVGFQDRRYIGDHGLPFGREDRAVVLERHLRQRAQLRLDLLWRCRGDRESIDHLRSVADRPRGCPHDRVFDRLRRHRAAQRDRAVAQLDDHALGLFAERAEHASEAGQAPVAHRRVDGQLVVGVADGRRRRAAKRLPGHLRRHRPGENHMAPVNRELDCRQSLRVYVRSRRRRHLDLGHADALLPQHHRERQVAVSGRLHPHGAVAPDETHLRIGNAGGLQRLHRTVLQLVLDGVPVGDVLAERDRHQAGAADRERDQQAPSAPLRGRGQAPSAPLRGRGQAPCAPRGVGGHQPRPTSRPATSRLVRSATPSSSPSASSRA